MDQGLTAPDMEGLPLEERASQPDLLGGKMTVRHLDAILAELESLPPLPAALGRLLELTARGGPGGAEGESAAAEAGRVIAADPALAAKFLAMANALEPGRYVAVGEAVGRLGLEAVRAAALSIRAGEAARPAYNGPNGLDARGFWEHSVAVASAARMLAERCGAPVEGEEVHVCGLLHDVGKLVLSSAAPKSYARALADAEARRASLAESERRVLGVDHLAAGRRLAERWRLPASILNVAWLHHQPPGGVPSSVADGGLIGLVGLADALARWARVGVSGNPAGGRSPGELAERLGIGREGLTEVTDRLPEAIERARRLMGLDRADSETVYHEALAGASVELGRLNERLRRRGEALAAQGRAMGHFCDFAASLGAEATESDVLAAVAEVFLAASESGGAAAGPVVAYSLDTQNEAILAVRLDGSGQPGWRTFGLAAGEPPMCSDAQEPGGVAMARLVADPSEWSDWARADSTTHQPLTCGGRLLGGVLLPSALEAAGRQEAEVCCRALAAGLGMALALVQQSGRATAAAEGFVEASQSLADSRQRMSEARTLAVVGDMAAGAAHELNNPLAVMSGRAQLMRDRARSEGQKRTWQTIIDQAERISDIISELMDYARPPAARAEDIAPGELLREAAEAFSSSDHPQAQSCRVDIETGDGTPDVRADRSQIRSVLVELLTNAATAGGSAARIRLSAGPGRAEAAVLLSVRDDGAGMDEKTAAKAFTPFYSEQRAGRRRGLGLPRAKRYVENNGGRIWIDSRPGDGTTVFIQLPSPPG